jgi:putative SOS response-associated peptidase YedK
MCVKLKGNKMSPGQIHAFMTKLGMASGTWGFNNGSQYNVRMESLGSVWRKLQFSRGVLIVDSFWEKDRQFVHCNGLMLKIGVLYNDRAEFSIITMDANEVVKPFHHRMPLVMTDESVQVFLDNGAPDVLPFSRLKSVA